MKNGWKHVLAAALATALAGCSTQLDQGGNHWWDTPHNHGTPDKAYFYVLVEQLVNGMLANAQTSGKGNPIAVASIADIPDLSNTNRPGQQGAQRA